MPMPTPMKRQNAMSLAVVDYQTAAQMPTPMTRQNAMSIATEVLPPAAAVQPINCSSVRLTVGETFKGMVVEKYPFPDAILGGWDALIDANAKKSLYKTAHDSWKYTALAWGTFIADKQDNTRNSILYTRLSKEKRDALFKPVTAPGQRLIMKTGAEAKLAEYDRRYVFSQAKMSGKYNKYAWDKLIGTDEQQRRILFETMGDDVKEDVNRKLAANKAWEKSFGSIGFEPTSEDELEKLAFPKRSETPMENQKAVDVWKKQFYTLLHKREADKRRQLREMVKERCYTVLPNSVM